MKCRVSVWLRQGIVWGVIGMGFASYGVIYAAEPAVERSVRERTVERSREPTAKGESRQERSEKPVREVFLRAER